VRVIVTQSEFTATKRSTSPMRSLRRSSSLNSHHVSDGICYNQPSYYVATEAELREQLLRIIENLRPLRSLGAT
jgi:hypothetical protein